MEFWGLNICFDYYISFGEIWDFFFYVFILYILNMLKIVVSGNYFYLIYVYLYCLSWDVLNMFGSYMVLVIFIFFFNFIIG